MSKTTKQSTAKPTNTTSVTGNKQVSQYAKPVGGKPANAANQPNQWNNPSKGGKTGSDC